MKITHQKYDKFKNKKPKRKEKNEYIDSTRISISSVLCKELMLKLPDSEDYFNGNYKRCDIEWIMKLGGVITIRVIHQI